MTSGSAPIIQTSRLTLRPHRREDYDDLHAVWSDPIVTTHIGGRASTAQESWFRLMRYLGHWPLMGYGYFAVCERASGQYLGDAGFADHKRGLHPDFDGVPEAGWVLAPHAFGQGYATEAMQAVQNWLDGELGRLRCVFMIETKHTASHRVATKLGYKLFTEISIGNDPISLLERG